MRARAFACERARSAQRSWRAQRTWCVCARRGRGACARAEVMARVKDSVCGCARVMWRVQLLLRAALVALLVVVMACQRTRSHPAAPCLLLSVDVGWCACVCLHADATSSLRLPSPCVWRRTRSIRSLVALFSEVPAPFPPPIGVSQTGVRPQATRPKVTSRKACAH